MVGLVLVSHSRPLVQALAALVQQMTAEQIPVAYAAGVGPDREEFGTDAVEISQAVKSVFSPDGVIVLMDLGSAILSADMALELLSPDIAEKVRFCPGPLVEGALAAAVQISLGNDLETVYQEATGALNPKQEQLGFKAPAQAEASQPTTLVQDQADQREVELTLKNPHGLHARPAARFVQAAAKFQAGVSVTNLTTGKGPVNARSLNALATLGALQNHRIRVQASGPQATEALETLAKMVNEGFGEGQGPEQASEAPEPSAQPQPQAQPTAEGSLTGVPVSEGIALGSLYHYQPVMPEIPTGPASDPQAEWERLLSAIDTTRKAIESRQAQQQDRLGEAQASIFDAHKLILLDPELHSTVQNRILASRQNAPAAWNSAIQEIAASYRELTDPYLQQRASDVLDVGNQVLLNLAGKQAAQIRLSEPVILYAQELTPTETAQLEMAKVLGIITAAGGSTSHSAILARAMGIPYISGVHMDVPVLPDGTPVGMDGSSGMVWIDPLPAVRSMLAARRQSWLDRRNELLKTSQETTYTRDGRRVEVFANIGSLPDAQAAVHNGAEGVGLLRTEFLFLTRQTPPGEEEQFESLAAIASALGDRPVTVRTLDAGGDKELPYLHLPAEANPFLGVRAIRVSLRDPNFFTIQLRAILRAAAGRHFRIMFPMIATVEEVWQARELLEKAHQNLSEADLPHAWPVETGIMVEIPAAAVLASNLAQAADFFSIGTNDLTQYTLAAERGNALLSGLADALHPSILHLINGVVAASHAAGKSTGVCGELAGDRLAVPILVGLGVDELSLNPGGIPAIKDLVRKIDSQEARLVAQAALKAASANEVRTIASQFLEKAEHPDAGRSAGA